MTVLTTLETVLESDLETDSVTDFVTDTALEAELAELEGTEPGPRVVAIGGGHGLAAALQAIRRYAGEITAVVSVADDGGSSGRLAAGLGIPPPGDIRRCLLALTPERSIWYELFDYRFGDRSSDRFGDRAESADRVESADVQGHSLGNLIIAALTDLDGDFTEAVQHAALLLGAMGRVVPAADRAIWLDAIIGGRRVEGQALVTRTRGPVERLILGPPGISAHPEAMMAIETADQIVIGPGSLFTSVIAALAVPGIADAIDRSAGRVVFVLNLVTQDGETLGMSGFRHLEAVIEMAGLRRPGMVLGHVGPLEVPGGLDEVTIESADGAGWEVRLADLALASAERPVHDPAKLAVALSVIR